MRRFFERSTQFASVMSHLYPGGARRKFVRTTMRNFLRRHTHKEGGVPYFSMNSHTLSFLVISLPILYFISVYVTTDSTQTNVKHGLVACFCVFVFFMVLQDPFRPKLFVRPHPAFWRVVLSLALVYLLLLTFMLFQNKTDARYFMSFLDPALNKPMPERSYATDCRIFTPEDPVSHFRNVKDNIQDEFFLAHLVGWWAKAVLFRDFTLTWTSSILFEFCELAFEYMLPNFAECWWDKLLLDVLGCNAVGITLGMLTCRFLEIDHCDWTGEERRPHHRLLARASDDETTDPYLSRARCHHHHCRHHCTDTAPRHHHHHGSHSPAAPPASAAGAGATPEPADAVSNERRVVREVSFFEYVSPWSFHTFRWSPTLSPRRYIAAWILAIVALIIDMTAFFLKTLLWVADEVLHMALVQSTLPLPFPLFAIEDLLCGSNTYRLLLWFTIGLPAIREYYEFIVNPSCLALRTSLMPGFLLLDERTQRLGPHCWLAIACVATEVLVCVKFGKGEFHNPMPFAVKVGWFIFAALSVILFALVCFNDRRRRHRATMDVPGAPQDGEGNSSTAAMDAPFRGAGAGASGTTHLPESAAAEMDSGEGSAEGTTE